MGKRKLATDEGSSRVAKKKRPSVSMVAAAHPTDLPLIAAGSTDAPSIEVSSMAGEAVAALAAPAPIEDTSVGIPSVVKEPNDDVIIIKAPIAPVEPAGFQAPSIPEDKSEDQQLVVTQVANDVSALDKEFWAYADTHKKWSN
ncbi:hypothetical protein COCNU_12G000200 [Cocos nucifera]|uniref:Uncharacterized protein n=1 Tax=Cocos nucifera TaxID=13894 RepID=A0A8K0IQJ0_COCNU|nr:hypothetical protein COCNU_12G000200 [Cocos nucifera]